jgi:inorganic pyrophosphatase
MKVFVENEAGLNKKNLYDEKTLTYKKTVEVSRQYPYPYGFILDTTSGDGDNLDCFILTNQQLTPGEVYECTPIGLMEQHETSAGGVPEEDHNILAVLEGELVVVTREIKETLTDFVAHVFDHLKDKRVIVGEFRNEQFAQKIIDSCQDKK